MKPASREVVCDTSPLQYLHQLGLLGLLPRMTTRVVTTREVAEELRLGREGGFDVPEIAKISWLQVEAAAHIDPRQWPADLGPGERSVLALASERPGACAILDDDFARETAIARGIPLKGTLGLLLEAKQIGLIEAVKPLIDRLVALGFHVSGHTQTAVLKLAMED